MLKTVEKLKHAVKKKKKKPIELNDNMCELFKDSFMRDLQKNII